MHDGRWQGIKSQAIRTKVMDMKCQRCLEDSEAKYRVYSDELDVKVCAKCAEEALRLGISIKALTSKDQEAVDQF